MRSAPADGASARLPTFLVPLRHPAFRLLFAGQVISNLGDWLDLLALLALIVFQWRLGAAALAALTLSQMIPGAVVAPLVGVFADRWPPRRVMIGCDLARAVIVLGLVWAPNLPIVLTLVTAASLLSTLFSPARQAAIRYTVPEADLLPATSLSRLSTNTNRVLGPALGGLLVALVGPRAAFVADALTFVASAVLLARLPAIGAAPTERGPTDQTVPDFWHELRVGLMHIVHVRALLVAVVAMMAEMLIVETNDSLSVLAFKGLGMGETLVGLAIGCGGLGNVAGALAIGQWGQRIRPLRLLSAGQVLVGCLETLLGLGVFFGLSHAPFAWLPLLVLAGVGFATMWVAFGYVLQRETPPALMGRVSASAGGLYTAAGLAGPPLGAVLAGRFGVGPVFAGTGVALALVGLAIILVRGATPHTDSPA